MNTQRRGTDLTIHIRLALQSLGDDPYKYDGKRLTIARKQEILTELRAKQRNLGVIKR